MITALKINDVLLGRGTGPNTFVGNKRFRQHVNTRQVDYKSCDGIAAKARIAQEVVDHVHGVGGRFVRQVKRGRKVNGLLVDGEWVEETEDVALEKAKQALREKYVCLDIDDEVTMEGHGRMYTGGSVISYSNLSYTFSPLFLQRHVVDTRLLLHQGGLSAYQTEKLAFPSRCSHMYLQDNRQSALLGVSKKHIREGEGGEQTDDAEVEAQKHLSGSSKISSIDFLPPPHKEEDEAATFLLSSLAVKDRPVFTPEQFEMERNTLTPVQRASARADLLGDLNVSDSPLTKRAKKYMDRKAIGFLVKQMKNKIANIPNNRKQALMEAEAMCRSEEFCDCRLEKFLRCEGMNAEV